MAAAITKMPSTQQPNCQRSTPVWNATEGVPYRYLLSRKQERNFHTAHRCLAAISRLRQRQNPNLVRASHPAGDSHHPKSDQSGQFRGKRLNIESGSQVVNSGQILELEFRKTRQNRPSTFLKVPFPSFYLPDFRTDYPSSEIKYTSLEPRGKGGKKFWRQAPLCRATITGRASTCGTDRH